jgi:hypothetical protein
MKTKDSSAHFPRFSRPISRIGALSLLTLFHLGGGVAQAAVVHNVTSIGQPINLNFGPDSGEYTFTGSFNIGAELSYSFERMRALQAVNLNPEGLPSGVLGTGLVYDEEDPPNLIEAGFGYNVTNYKITSGNSISSTLPFTYLSTSVDPFVDGALGELSFINTGNTITGGGSARQISLTPTKTFDFTTVNGFATIDYSPLFPQGAAAIFGLQIRQTSSVDQINTTDLAFRVQPGVVSPSSFTTATNSLFRWDLKGNTTDGAGTNWTQINFANQVATFTEGTEFVIAFDHTTNFLDPFWGQSRSWDIFNGGTISGAGADDFLANLNFTFIGGVNRPSNLPGEYSQSHFSFDQSTGTLNWTAIPEPTSALSGILLAAGLMRRRRR